MRARIMLVAVLCACAFAQNAVVVVPQSARPDAPALSGAEAVTIPQMLSYQGKLTDTTGIPVPDGDYSVVFRLYTAPSGGSPVWNETQSVTTEDGLFSVLLGSVTPISSMPDGGAAYLTMAVEGGAELTPRLRIASAGYAYLSGRAADADLLQGKDTSAFDSRFLNEGQASSVTSNMIVNGTIAAADLGQMGAASGQVMKWTGSAWAPANDSVGAGGSGTVRKVVQATGIVVSPSPLTDSGTVRFDSTWGDARFVNESQTAGGGLTGTYPSPTIANNAVGSAQITDGSVTSADIRDTTVNTAELKDAAVTAAKINQMGATTNQVLKWTGSAWAPRNDSFGGGVGDSVPGSFAVTNDLRVYGKGRIGSGNSNNGTAAFVAGQSNSADGNYSAVAGGADNSAAYAWSFVGGGSENYAGDTLTLVGGGSNNSATGNYAVVVGGQENAAAGLWATIVGGGDNAANGYNTFIGGGAGNIINSNNASIVGGANNVVTSGHGFIGGGQYDTVAGSYATVAGGQYNKAGGTNSFVGGGRNNKATQAYDLIAGGGYNVASGGTATIAGGSENAAGGSGSFIGGGYQNTASAQYATIPGGYQNRASGTHSVVVGGEGNLASGTYAVAGGLADTASGRAAGALSGWRNVASDSFAVVCGGDSNRVTKRGSSVGGGTGNSATGRLSGIGGGRLNSVLGPYSYVGGGRMNWVGDFEGAFLGGGFYDTVANHYAAVGGGINNKATGYASTIGGGYGNLTSSSNSTVGGGQFNSASGGTATVGGGDNNTSSGGGATVGGGYENTASGLSSTIPGGSENAARGYCSFAAGRLAHSNHNGSFVWSDSCSASDSVYTGGANQWRVRARGGAWFYSNLAKSTGAYLAPGSNSWESACDSMTKEDFRPVDRRELLEKVAALRVRDYKMKDQNDGTRHIGPVAQDFHNAFEFGGNETSINMADADGVLLAAVQALYEQNQNQQAEIEALKAELKRK